VAARDALVAACGLFVCRYASRLSDQKPEKDAADRSYHQINDEISAEQGRPEAFFGRLVSGCQRDGLVPLSSSILGRYHSRFVTFVD
jgi:hypothetical protein